MIRKSVAVALCCTLVLFVGLCVYQGEVIQEQRAVVLNGDALLKTCQVQVVQAYVKLNAKK